jgi:hypothetical protein
VVERVRIRPVRDAADPEFDTGYALLRRTFPRTELLPKRDWRHLMHERNAGLWTDLGWHFLVAERGRRTIGAASGTYLGTVNVGVVGYVAVDARDRSGGIGPRLRRGLRAGFERDARRLGRRGLEAIVGEVAESNPWLRHLVRREGAIALDFPYYQPSLTPRRVTVPLVLYYQPLLTPRRSLSAAWLRRLLYTLWRRPYRVAKPLSRPAFRRMLRALQGRTRVGQRALPPLPRRAARAGGRR